MYQAEFKYGVHSVERRPPPDKIRELALGERALKSHRRRHSALNYYRLPRNVGSRT